MLAVANPCPAVFFTCMIGEAVPLGHSGRIAEMDRDDGASGGQEYFDLLFVRLYPALHGLAGRMLADTGEAEDVVQEAFVKLATARVLSRPEPEVAAWLRRVTLNLASNRLRERGRATRRLERVGRLEDSTDQGASPASAALRDEERAEVRAALARLSARQRDCLVLRHAGHSYAEIAETLDIAIGSVGVLLARAERAFREIYLEEHHGNPDLS